MLTGRVGLARRNLLADRRRLGAGILGVGLALMLVLLLDGLWAGVQRQATIYPDRVGAQLFVAQRGVADFLGESSTIPRATVAEVQETPGVKWADPVRGQFVVFELHGKKVAAYVVGSVPGRHGGPWSLVSGRMVHADDEVVLDQALARRHGLDAGQTIEVGGYPLRVVGLADASAPMTGFLFVTHSATDVLLRSPDTTSYVLVGTRDPGAVKARLERRGLTVFTRDELADNDRELYTSIFGSVIKLMVAVAFVAGALVVGLTIYASVVERRREYGIVKAIGGSSRVIAGAVLRQSVALTAIGLLLGVVLFLAARALIAELRPQFSIVLTTGGLLTGLAAALLMALVASIVPARRVATAEPASVYREH
jgi:putative ABC transport system permease protein